jgi:hypothetical protein
MAQEPQFQFAFEKAKWIDASFVGTQGTFFADVDGDGRADAIAVNDDDVTVRQSSSGGQANRRAFTTHSGKQLFRYYIR